MLAPEQVRYVQETSVRRDDVVLISALTGAGVSDLQRMMSDKLTTQSRVRSIDLPAEDGAALAWLHANGEVLDSQAEGERLHVRVRMSDADHARVLARKGCLFPLGLTTERLLFLKYHRRETDPPRPPPVPQP